MIKHLLIFILLFTSLKSFAAAEIIVKAGTISYGGYSKLDDDQTNIYAGIAGRASSCVVDGVTPCNTCPLSVGSTEACNQLSVYPTLKFTVSFNVSKSVTGAVAKLFADTNPIATVAAANYTQDSSLVTIETTWSAICPSVTGLDGACQAATVIYDSVPLKFGVDSDNSGDVEEAERKTITLKFHYIPPGDTASGIQTYCAASPPTGYGFCKLTFLPGDEKVYVDEAIFGGADVTSIDFDAIAVFPIPVSTGGEGAAYTSFQTSLTSPIILPIETNGDIPDSQVTGGLGNYQKYCLVYGTRNKAQNIYKIVAGTSTPDTTTSCVTPSEVVGILEDKHCFISTAAFGSEMAPEVDTFRKFRNEFLLTNAVGRIFVKAYYRWSPPVADVIAKNEILRTSARVGLYPLLLFSHLALAVGFGWAFLISIATAGAIVLALRRRKSSAGVLLMLCLLSPSLRAEVIPTHQTIPHGGAKEGLIKITKEGTYIYDTKRELGSESSKITFGQANNPEITIEIEGTDSQGVPNGTFTEFTFEDFYNDASGLIIGYDYEKFPWIDKGKLGYQLGVGLMIATGNGRLVATPNGPSVESFTFLTLPINAGGVYRFEWKDKQILAPYVCGGGTYVVLMEKREDIATPNFTGGVGFYGAGGLLLNVAAIDDEAGYALESEYGINALWLTMEFRVTEVNSESFSYSNAYVSAGLSFDF